MFNAAWQYDSGNAVEVSRITQMIEHESAELLYSFSSSRRAFDEAVL